MSGMERMTVTLPSDLVAEVEEAVAGGAYASGGEVVREALRDWQAKRASQGDELVALRAEIARGLADVEAGRLVDFDADRIVARGRTLSDGRSASD